MLSWLLLPFTYLLGSVSFAWLAARAKGIDLRTQGSGNLGATNAGRVMGRKWFFIIFGADLAKGLVPVLIALALVENGQAHATLPVLTAACAILGHSFTCFHGFKGGKAVATSLGVLIGLVHVAAGITFGIWLLVWALCYTVFRLKASDAVGPASVIAALAMPFAHLGTYPQPWAMLNLPLTIFLILVSTLVIVRHRSNIAKLLGKAPPPPEA
jgi:acyl phosphate:glycerol-3-phosphate acyltransferase